MAGSIENRLSELGIELPKAAKPLANYLLFVLKFYKIPNVIITVDFIDLYDFILYS